MFLFDPSIPISERLEAVFNALMHALRQRRMLGDAVLAVAAFPLFVRVQRLRNRVLALIKRIEAGTVREWVARRAVVAPRAMDEAARMRLAEFSRAWKGIPRGRGWLLPLLPSEAALRGYQFENLLRDPQMRALLAKCPRLGRMLRPFCKMLAVDESLLLVAPGEEGAVVGPPVMQAAPVVAAPEVEDVGLAFIPLWQRQIIR